MKSSLKKIAVVAVCGGAVLWLVACSVIYHEMRQPPEQFGRAMSKIPGEMPFMIFPFETLWIRARAGTLHIGDPAPDFSLAKLDKTDRIQLSSFATQGKPVVLIFGSYT